jgi:FMN reductase (NADPH)
MENPTLDLIHNHASVRHYKADPLPATIIERVVAAGQCASTSSNLQMVSVIAVTDAGKRDRLAILSANQAFIRQAPVFLVWCADLARLERACHLRGYVQVVEFTENFLLAVVDCSLAAQNAALAAESLGLGICYIGALRNHPQEVIDLLGLPKLVFPLFGMTLGWPEKPGHLKPRLPLQAILHWEEYDPNPDNALAEYDSVMIATGIYQGRQVPLPGKPVEMEQYGWTEHSARRVSQAVRTGLRAVIEKQGFELK